MFTGKTQNLGIIGFPVAHSLSPVMQNVALGALGLDYAYMAFQVTPHNLPVAVEGLRVLGFRGFNVTVPHKTAIIPLLDEVTDEARLIGAVNTVVNDDGVLRGYNTDADGFCEALLAAGFSPQGKNAAVLGAGGAARSVLGGLLKSGVGHITVGARSGEKAQALAAAWRDYRNVNGFSWDSEDFRLDLRQADLLVNATPLGMTPDVDAAPPVSWELLKPTAFVYDLIYTPAETRFLREAQGRGHRTLNGEGMLIGQGAVAFRLWTGQSPDKEAMSRALHDVLGG